MASESSCPDLDALQRLAMNQASPAEAFGLHKHLVKCVSCVKSVAALREATHMLAAMPVTAGGRDYGATLITPSVTSKDGQQQEKPPPPTSVSIPLGNADLNLDFLAPAEGPDELGRLGQYRVQRVLGAGGMGIVFEAEDVDLQRKAALKVMRPQVASDLVCRQRFQQEARAVAALAHDHIVSIYQVGEDRGIPFIAMQFLHGETLESRLAREKKLPLAEILRIGREVAEGLAAAHAHGLIHRDIKPSNIWLETSRVKLLDFGLARTIGNDAQNLTRSGFIVGTLGYMAPEQARGRATDNRSDLFSLGCVIYEMGTGSAPFSGPDAMSRLMALAVEQPPPPRQLNSDLPPKLSELILWLLSKLPEDRPRSARLVVETLAAIERGPTTNAADGLLLTPQRSGATAASPSWGKNYPATDLANATPGKKSGSLLTIIMIALALVLFGWVGYHLVPVLTGSLNQLNTPSAKQ